MNTKNFSLYPTVGLFVLIGLACVAYLTLTLANTSFFDKNQYMLEAKFSTVNGLRVGSSVEISGVPVGKVTAIELDQQLYQALVTLHLEKGILVPEDSTAAIKTSGLIGDKYINIIPGGSSQALQHGEAILDTQAALDIEEMISKYIFGSVNK
ncbi:outer membrane lipid asymmetry maintenance protein MlaD [Desulfovibrionales bacterium]